jgi:hypothetical protein
MTNLNARLAQANFRQAFSLPAPMIQCAWHPLPSFGMAVLCQYCFLLLLAASCCSCSWLLHGGMVVADPPRPTQTPSQPTQSRVLHRLQSPKLLPAFGDQYISLSIPLMTHPSFPSFSASFLELLSNSLLTPFTCPSNKNLFELSLLSCSS